MVHGGVLQSAFNRLQKTIGNITLGGLGAYEETLGMARVYNLSLESEKHVTAGKTLKRLTKLMDRLHGIGLGYDEGMESKTIMVPANGMVYKLRGELKNDCALLFGLRVLAYLDIGGEYFGLLHPLFALMCTSYFCLVLAVMPWKSIVL